MSTKIEETQMAATGPSWYSKMFGCVNNGNRVDPGKVEFPDCDFFNVGPRRTLRILLPTPRGSVYYEPMANERPVTIDENFVSRWAMRPHPSGNCRCSFRRSNRASTNEERIISAELNRIRTSISEAEKIGKNLDEIEQRISVNLESLGITDGRSTKTRESRSDVDEKLAEIANVGPAIGNKTDDDVAIKNKIVKDLERYIDDLLREVLNDTMKFFSDAEDSSRKNREAGDNDSSSRIVSSEVERPRSVRRSTRKKIFGDETAPLNIKFAFHEDDDSNNEAEKTIEALRITDQNGGYVNRGYAGTKTDPDSLDFDLRKPVNAEITMDNLDCVDSGINSVETIEFQTSQEPSLEESLMKIIDAKLGRAPLKRSWEDLSDVNPSKNDERTIPENLETIENAGNSPSSVKTNLVVVDDKMADVSTLDETGETKIEIRRIVDITENNINSTEQQSGISSDDLDNVDDHPNFDKLRLELMGNDNETKKSTIATFREKFIRKFGKNRETNNDEKNLKIDDVTSSPVELRVKRDIVWTNRESTEIANGDNHVDFVKFRKSKKPAIVFIHGFGSSAEIFEHQLEYFSNLGYPCIAPEMLGHGMSSAPDRSRDYHFDKLLKDFEMILQHYAFKPGRKCVLVAHNYGCSFATALAYKYDTKIHQLVLISGGGPTPLAAPSTEGAAHCCLRAMLNPLLMCGLHRDILYSARGRQHPYCGSEPPEQWPSHMKYVLDGMVWPGGDYVFHRRISTPTLLIHGLRDNKVSLVQECQMERTIIKAFLDAIPTAGHTPMTDCPEQVNHMIHCFIDLWRRKKR